MNDELMLRDHLQLSHGISPQYYGGKSAQYLHNQDHEYFDPKEDSQLGHRHGDES